MKSYSRRELLNTAAGGAVLTAFLAGGVGAALADQKGGGGDDKSPEDKKKDRGFSFSVVPDITTLDFTRDIAPGDTFATGPFYIEGPIYLPSDVDATGNPGTATPIGTFRSTGWITDGLTGHGLSNQSFEFPSGSLEVVGADGPLRAVAGGTGQFRNVRGQGTYEDINTDNLSFHIVFKLLGAGEKLH